MEEKIIFLILIVFVLWMFFSETGQKLIVNAKDIFQRNYVKENNKYSGDFKAPEGVA